MDTKKLNRAFGVRLRELRESKGLTQQDLAGLIHLSTEYISRIERGVASPSFETLAKLSTALLVSPDALFDFGEHR